MTAYQNWKLVKKYHRDSEPKLSIEDWLYEQEMEAVRREREKPNGNGSEPRAICHCSETLIKGVRYPLHRAIDCEYTAQRSFLVAEAERITTQIVGDPIGDSQHGYRWTREFVRQVQKLSAPLLRQSNNGAHELK